MKEKKVLTSITVPMDVVLKSYADFLREFHGFDITDYHTEYYSSEPVIFKIEDPNKES